MIAFVLGVILFSIDSGEIKPVLTSTSENITLAPVNAIVVFVGSAVKAVLITSSFFPTPININAICNAAVPEFTVKQYGFPNSSESFVSNSNTVSPSAIYPL